MQLELLLEKMDTEKKPEMLESVWDSLYQENSDILSPSWHKEVLEKREDETPTSWESVKKELLSED